MAPLINIGATMPVWRRPAINVTVCQCPMGAICDETLSTRVPAVEAHHIGSDSRLIDKYKAGRIKPALLADPASARGSHIGSLPLCRPQAFFDGDAMASEETRQRAAAPAD